MKYSCPPPAEIVAPSYVSPGRLYLLYCITITYLPVPFPLYCQLCRVCTCGLFVLFIMAGTVQSNAQEVKMGHVCLRAFAEATDQRMCQVY